MPIPSKYLVDFQEHGIYHVFNRTNNQEKLFLSDDNRHFFLKKYNKYLSPYSETYAWCLLPNHFHFLIKIKSIETIKEILCSGEQSTLSSIEQKFMRDEISISQLIENAYKRFFQSYALAFNKVHNRKGNLFYKPFKRLEIENESHFNQVIIYIHTNPTKHKISNDFTTWKWSSYQTILSNSKTSVPRQEILNWFGGIEQFEKIHHETSENCLANRFSIED
jgi:putative transposase